MESLHPARQQLRRLLQHPDEQFPLAEAALCVAWEDQPEHNPQRALAHLDTMSAVLRKRLSPEATPTTIVSAINQYLFDEMGLHGNPHCYDQPDPADSFLDQVLERGCGLPILLSIVYLEIGWRLGLPVEGLGLPGHFIVRYRSDEQELFIDPYEGGRLWSYDDCLRQISVFQSELTPPLIAEVMTPTPRRAILERLLRNLKNTYLSRREFQAALATSERILLLNSEHPAEWRDRGLLRLRTGAISGALLDLEHYALLAPDAPDLFDLQMFARSVLDHSAPWN